MDSCHCHTGWVMAALNVNTAGSQTRISSAELTAIKGVWLYCGGSQHECQCQAGSKQQHLQVCSSSSQAK